MARVVDITVNFGTGWSEPMEGEERVSGNVRIFGTREEFLGFAVRILKAIEAQSDRPIDLMHVDIDKHDCELDLAPAAE